MQYFLIRPRHDDFLGCSTDVKITSLKVAKTKAKDNITAVLQRPASSSVGIENPGIDN